MHFATGRMSIRILIDMNLSPDWVPLLQHAGWSATHWSIVGDSKATDRTIMGWAEANGYIVFTHDLDSGLMKPRSAPTREPQLANAEPR